MLAFPPIRSPTSLDARAERVSAPATTSMAPGAPQRTSTEQQPPSSTSGARTSEGVTLRPATAEDAPALALVGAATFLEAFTWMLPGADIIAHAVRNHSVEVYRSYLAHPETRITLAEAAPGGAPVGYAMLTLPELPSFAVQPSDIELKRLYLFSRFRSAGTPVLAFSPGSRQLEPIPNLRGGQALMDAATEAARAMGRTRLLLGTHAGNAQAIAFYQRNGFAEAGTRSFQVGSQMCCDLIFARQL